MSMNVIDEYLVKLGASVDQSGMQRFYQALREAKSVSENNAEAIAKAFFKAQTEIVGGFAAIGTATLGMIDKVAMADQQYRLMALRMFTTKEVARSLTLAMDKLGVTLEDTWDPEVRERMQKLIDDQRAMAPNGDFDAQMRKIRDIRFEFTRMEVELEYLTMHVVQDFFKALGFGPDELLKRLQKFNDWVTHSLPEISARVVGLIKPIWMDVVGVFNATKEAVEATALAFTNLVGIFDPSVSGTEFNLQKTAKAVGEVIHTFAVFAETIAHVEEMLAHLFSALALALRGNFSEAGQQLNAAFNSITSGVLGGVMGGVTGGLLGGGAGASGGAVVGGAVGALFGPEGIPIGAAIGSAVGGVGGSATGALGGSFLGSNALDHIVNGGGSGGGGGTGIGSLLDKYARQYGVDPRLAHALAMQESGERQFGANGQLLRSSTGAMGVMQLTRDTAAALGIDRSDTESNVRGGMYLFKHLMDKYHDPALAVAAYHEGEGKMNAILAGRATLSSEGASEVSSVMRRMGRSGDVHIGSIVVHVDKPNAVNEDVANAVVQKVRWASNQSTQRNLSEFQDMSYGY